MNIGDLGLNKVKTEDFRVVVEEGGGDGGEKECDVMSVFIGTTVEFDEVSVKSGIRERKVVVVATSMVVVVATSVVVVTLGEIGGGSRTIGDRVSQGR